MPKDFLTRLHFPAMLFFAYIILHGPVATAVERLIPATTTENGLPISVDWLAVCHTPNVRLLPRFSVLLQHEQPGKCRVLTPCVCDVSLIKPHFSSHDMHGRISGAKWPS